jgi:Spy/CpxP family protein refolding chaperone
MERLSFRMKSSFLTTALAAAVVFTGAGTLGPLAAGTVPAAFAQDQPSPAPPSGGGHGRMGQVLMSLNLNDSQKSQIRSIMADTRKQNENVTDRDTRRANYKAAMTKVEAVLTPAQRTALHAKMDAMRQQNPPPPHS